MPSCASSKTQQRNGRLAAVALVLALLPSCLGTSPQQGPAPTAAEEVQEMLDRRVERLEARDVNGYLAPLSPEAQAAEQTLAQNSLAVPLVNRRLRLTRPASLPKQASSLDEVKVELSFAYEGLPTDNSFRVGMVYDLARDSSGWRVQTSRPETPMSYPAWATGAVQTRRTEHFLALFRPGLTRVDETLQVAERARTQLEQKITFPLEPGHVLWMAADRAEYEQMSAQSSPVSAIAQAETAFEITPTNIRVRSRQIVVNLQKLYEDGSAEETFVHELGHLALAQQTRPFTPAWVSESAAMFLAGTRPVATWREGVRRGTFESISFVQLNRSAGLGRHDPSGEAASFEYAYAAAAAWYLTETFGTDKYFAFYRSYADVSPATFYERLPETRTPEEEEQAVAALAEETTGVELQEAFGIGSTDLDVRVRTYIREQTRRR